MRSIDFAKLSGLFDQYDAAKQAGALPSRLETIKRRILSESGYRTLREARRALRP